MLFVASHVTAESKEKLWIEMHANTSCYQLIHKCDWSKVM